MNQLKIKKDNMFVCIDFGLSKIGVAISLESINFASPVDPLLIKNKSFNEIIIIIVNKIKMLEDQFGQKCKKLIIGNPILRNGKESDLSKQCQKLSNDIEINHSIQTELFDERFTSRAADQILRDRGLSRIKRSLEEDSLSASIILNSYLESNIY